VPETPTSTSGLLLIPIGHEAESLGITCGLSGATPHIIRLIPGLFTLLHHLPLRSPEISTYIRELASVNGFTRTGLREWVSQPGQLWLAGGVWVKLSFPTSRLQVPPHV
jgi:hypothetical protein